MNGDSRKGIEGKERLLEGRKGREGDSMEEMGGMKGTVTRGKEGKVTLGKEAKVIRGKEGQDEERENKKFMQVSQTKI